MSTQSNVQNVIQNGVGTHTAGQEGVPSGVNNGNPNGVYNWSSYIPTILRDSLGTPNGATFNLATAQAPASSPGYSTPFTADPFIAVMLSQLQRPTMYNDGMPPAYGGNSIVNTILNNMLRPRTQAATAPTGTSTPTTGTTAPVVTTPATTNTATAQTPTINNPPAGSVGNSVASPVNDSWLIPSTNDYSVYDANGNYLSGGSGGSSNYSHTPGNGVGSVYDYNNLNFLPTNIFSGGTGLMDPNNFNTSMPTSTGVKAPSNGGFFSRLGEMLLPSTNQAGLPITGIANRFASALGDSAGFTGWGDGVSGNNLNFNAQQAIENNTGIGLARDLGNLINGNHNSSPVGDIGSSPTYAGQNYMFNNPSANPGAGINALMGQFGSAIPTGSSAATSSNPEQAATDAWVTQQSHAPVTAPQAPAQAAYGSTNMSSNPSVIRNNATMARLEQERQDALSRVLEMKRPWFEAAK